MFTTELPVRFLKRPTHAVGGMSQHDAHSKHGRMKSVGHSIDLSERHETGMAKELTATALVSRTFSFTNRLT